MLTARLRKVTTNTAGEAGENVIRHSLKQSKLLDVTNGFGPITRVGITSFKGALDSGAWVPITAENGLMERPTFAPMEVKNRRLTVYPIHKELHQLLSKAAQFQKDQPEWDVIPVLFCRGANYWTFRMAQDLGFFIHERKQQYVYPTDRITKAKIEEIRSELHLDDLVILNRQEDPPRMIKVFEKTLPNKAKADGPGRWRLVSEQAAGTFESLRQERLTPAERQQTITDLRDNLTELLEDQGYPCYRDWATMYDPDATPI